MRKIKLNKTIFFQFKQKKGENLVDNNHRRRNIHITINLNNSKRHTNNILQHHDNTTNNLLNHSGLPNTQNHKSKKTTAGDNK